MTINKVDNCYLVTKNGTLMVLSLFWYSFIITSNKAKSITK